MLLFFAFLFLKLCHTELREITELFRDIIVAAMKELKFQGGRAAKCNIILSAILAVVFVLMVLTDVLPEVRRFLDGSSENQGGAKYVLFASLFFFFFISLCFICALERYSVRTRSNKVPRQDARGGA